MINQESYSLFEIAGGAKLAIAPITPYHTLINMVSEAELLEVESFGSEHRRSERLSSRALLRRVLSISSTEQNIVSYTALGAPYLIASSLKISISHSRTHVAIIVGHRPCAVDIESTSRNFERVSSRYVSPAERALITAEGDLARIWCAKEALYKFAATAELSLLGDIEIVEIGPSHLVGKVKGIDSTITIKTMRYEEHFVAYIA